MAQNVEEKKLDSLIPDDHNFNVGTEYGQRLIEKSLYEFGAGRGILLDKNGRIIAGNKTVENAAAIGLEDVIIVPTDGTKLVATMRTDIDLDSERGRAMALADNATGAANLKWDEKELKAAAEKWQVNIEDWGVSLAENAEAFESAQAEEDGFKEEDEDIETRCKPGDLWHLGRHRLMCGDSTKEADVEKLMQGELADLWLTDPPYNVAIKNSQGMTIANDNMESAAFLKFLTQAFSAAYSVMKPGCPFYIWFASREHVNFENALNAVGLTVREELIWKKNALVLGRSDYQWIHEPCLYGWKEGTGHYFAPIRTETTVLPDPAELDFDKMSKAEMKELLELIYSEDMPTTIIQENKPTKDADHPTMKPVRLFGRLVNNSSKVGDIVLDSFGGSGTTIVACEQMGRRARLMEYDPHYCDVILTRFEKLTGIPAIKMEDKT